MHTHVPSCMHRCTYAHRQCYSINCTHSAPCPICTHVHLLQGGIFSLAAFKVRKNSQTVFLGLFEEGCSVTMGHQLTHLPQNTVDHCIILPCNTPCTSYLTADSLLPWPWPVGASFKLCAARSGACCTHCSR